MKTEKIMDGDVTLALIIRNADWEEGLSFASSEGDYQQVGTWGFNKGYKSIPHRHLVAPRKSLRTQEVVFVKQGRIKANIYTEREELLTSVDLEAGDTIILLNGGHGYEILEDDTMALEVKNGPYPGPEKDRKRF